MKDEFDYELHPELLGELSADEQELLSDMPELTELGGERRKFLGQVAAGGSEFSLSSFWRKSKS